MVSYAKFLASSSVKILFYFVAIKLCYLFVDSAKQTGTNCGVFCDSLSVTKWIKILLLAKVGSLLLLVHQKMNQ